MLLVALDFDGTVVTHSYPKVGVEIGATEWLRILMVNDCQFILNTMRCHNELTAAIEWFRKREIPLYGANKNPDQFSWTDSPKVYAHVYVDDSALGCPLIYPPGNGKPYADWAKVGPMLLEMAQKRKQK